MGLVHSGCRDFYELSLSAHLLNIRRTGIPHTRTQPTHQLMNNSRHRTFIRHASFDAFGNQLFSTRIYILKISIARSLRVRHGAQRTHATIGLVTSALIELNLTWRLFGASKHTTNHHDVRTCGDHLRDIARISNATIRYYTNIGVLQRLDNIGYCRNLRNTNARYDTRGTDRTRTDTHFNCVSASLCQISSCIGSGNVAADYRNLWVFILYIFHLIQHELRVTVSCINNYYVDTRFDYCFNTIGRIGTGTYGCGHAQSALFIFTSIGIVF